ncbi:MAG: hypothetical protein ABIM99_00070 [Candidatus Dojkabacteria bacterium]
MEDLAKTGPLILVEGKTTSDLVGTEIASKGALSAYSIYIINEAISEFNRFDAKGNTDLKTALHVDRIEPEMRTTIAFPKRLEDDSMLLLSYLPEFSETRIDELSEMISNIENLPAVSNRVMVIVVKIVPKAEKLSDRFKLEDPLNRLADTINKMGNCNVIVYIENPGEADFVKQVIKSSNLRKNALTSVNADFLMITAKDMMAGTFEEA